MRLRQYLTENINNPTEVLNILKTECSQIIKDYNKAGKVLFRGTNDGHDALLLAKNVHLEGRNPLDTKKAWHNWLNEYFIPIFGWPVRNGISTSPNRSQSGRYGNRVSIFFPVDGYKFVYSLKVEDLFQSIVSRMGLDFMDDMDLANIRVFHNEVLDMMKNNPGIKWGNLSRNKIIELGWKDKEYHVDWMSVIEILKTYTDKNLPKGIQKAPGEIMFNARYYLLDTRNPEVPIKEFLAELGLKPKGRL
jgi:hypothetical protein